MWADAIAVVKTVSLAAYSAAILCLVVGVSDGDTLKVRCGDAGQYQQVTLRLSAVDAPEKAQAFGQRSKQALSDLCFQQQATIKVKNTDRYGRSVADVACRGKDAGAEQVRAGMAWVYRQYAKGYGQLDPIEDDAKRGKRGLWQDAHPVPPWEWRRAAKHPGSVQAANDDTCHVGPRGGRYQITASGHKRYGC